MAKTAGEIAGKLKELIDKNGPAYLVEEPYRVYKELTETKSADRKTAGAILCFLVSEAAGKASCDSDAAELSNAVQKECGFIKEWQTGWQRSCFASTLLITDRSGREKMAKAFGLSLMRNSRTPGKDLRYGMKETEQLTAPMKQI